MSETNDKTQAKILEAAGSGAKVLIWADDFTWYGTPEEKRKGETGNDTARQIHVGDGAHFVLFRGRETPEAQLLARLLRDARAENTKLREANQRTRDADFWKRLKYLFTGEL